MKRIIFMGVVLLTGVAGEAMAACSGAQVTNTTGTHETAIVSFKTLNATQSTTVAGLTFTATASRSSAQVADAFRSLSNGATTGGGVSGTYSGALNGWSSNAGTGANVTFTSVSVGNVVNISTATTGSTALGVRTTEGHDPVAGLTTLLTGKTVCVGTAGNWQAQEYHQLGGNLIDWKKGAGDPVDPTASVGSWSITGSDAATRVNYTYDTVYNDAVWNHGNGTYSFCDQNANETVAVKILSGQVSCQ